MIYSLLRRDPLATERVLAMLCFAFLTGVMAQAKLYLPGNPVPVTLQVLAVLLTGLMLRPSDALAAMGMYLALIAGGMPMAAGGAAGVGVLGGATAGYLLAFPLVAYTVARLVGQQRSTRRSLVGALVGIALLYLCGASWLGYTLHSATQAWQLGVAPFLVLDLAKALVAVFAGNSLIHALHHLR